MFNSEQLLSTILVLFYSRQKFWWPNSQQKHTQLIIIIVSVIIIISLDELQSCWPTSCNLQQQVSMHGLTMHGLTPMTKGKESFLVVILYLPFQLSQHNSLVLLSHCGQKNYTASFCQSVSVSIKTFRLLILFVQGIFNIYCNTTLLRPQDNFLHLQIVLDSQPC